jgi:hypothetical protein
MRWRIAGIAIACAVASGASGTSTSAARLGGLCGVGAPGHYRGAPPRFEVPAHGRERIVRSAGGRECLLYRPNGKLFAAAYQDAAGHVLEGDYYDANGNLVTEIAAGGWPDDPLTADPSPNNATRAAADVSCAADDENPGAAKWLSTNDWWLNHTIPGALNVTNTISSLRSAHTEWTSNDTWCSSIGDSTTFTASYQGRNDVSFGQDGISEVGWGDTSKIGICNQTPAPAGCEQTWYNARNPDVAVEGDIRFMASYTWSNLSGGSAGDFDVWYTAAHEIGHLAQFGHVSDNQQNVMDPNFTNNGDTSGRKLGKGDALENNSKY